MSRGQPSAFGHRRQFRDEAELDRRNEAISLDEHLTARDSFARNDSFAFLR
jgi:hypothetical protein